MSSASQRTFLSNGGIYAGVLQAKYDSGELVSPEKYEFQEYPKMVRIPRGKATVTKSTMRLRGKEELPYEWEEEVAQFDEHLVNSEVEEDRVLNGGKSDAEIAQEREEALMQCKQRGLAVDRSWPLFRLQQALGTAPTAAEVDDLRQKVADLEEKAALKRRIAELEAAAAGRVAEPIDEAEHLRAELRALHVEVDGRWGVSKLRYELERATAPSA